MLEITSIINGEETSLVRDEGDRSCLKELLKDPFCPIPSCPGQGSPECPCVESVRVCPIFK